MKDKKIAILIGSLRKGSLNRKMAMNLVRLAPPSLKMEILEIGSLPMYNEDLDNENPPPEWIDFRQRLKTYDGVVFVTPEYNRSVPGALVNAIDVGSRPYGRSAWDGKPAAIMSVSPGGIGGFGANHHLRQSLVFLNMPTLQQPEAYIGNAARLFDEDGEIAVDSTRDFVKMYLQAFSNWVETHSKEAERSKKREAELHP